MAQSKQSVIMTVEDEDDVETPGPVELELGPVVASSLEVAVELCASGWMHAGRSTNSAIRFMPDSPTTELPRGPAERTIRVACFYPNKKCSNGVNVSF